jgi:hypothetical protein
MFRTTICVARRAHADVDRLRFVARRQRDLDKAPLLVCLVEVLGKFVGVM